MVETADDGSAVRVAVRVRPRLAGEASTDCLTKVAERPQIVLGKERSFTFDHVFDPTSSQESIHRTCVAPLLESFFQGYNATIFAYGQTGSGKTYTMGSASTHVSDHARGIIPRAISDVFSHIESVAATHTCRVRVSFLELYNEEIRDLLDPGKERGAIAVREDVNGNVAIVGAEEEVVTSSEAMLQCLHRGTLRRSTAETNMNETSSRSHAIFSVAMEKCAKGSASADEANGSRERASTEGERIVSNFHFVDLAGSERAKRTLAEGQRMKEGIAINYSLLVLGNVISALGDDRRHGNHVPYRDSVLTRMLQHSLGGNSRTLMIACVSPSEVNLDETLNTLRYANRAKNIKNKPVVNRDPHAAQLAQLRGELRATQLELLRMRSGKGSEATLEELMREEGNRQFLASIGTSAALVPATAAPSRVEEAGLSNRMAKLQLREAELASECEQLRKQMAQRNDEIRKLCERHAAELQSLEMQLVQTQAQPDERCGRELSGAAQAMLREMLEVNLAKNARLEEELTLLRSSREGYDAAEGGGVALVGSLTLDEEQEQALTEKEEQASQAEQAFRISQIKMQQALKDLSTNIELKEQLMAELSANQQRFEQLRTHYEQEPSHPHRSHHMLALSLPPHPSIRNLHSHPIALTSLHTPPPSPAYSHSPRTTPSLSATHTLSYPVAPSHPRLRRQAVAERESEVASTNQQLETVQAQLEAKVNDEATQRQQQDLVAKYSERLRNLQQEIKKLKKRQSEYAQMERLNRERCFEIGRLQSQVNEMKKAKNTLQRKAQDESAQFREWKQIQLREISQLRREGRRVALEHQKLLEAHSKQNAILKRRTEEVWAVQKRLRETEASRRLRATATGRPATAPREAWGGEGSLRSRREGCGDGAADRLVEGELAARVKERTRGMQVERAIVERAELAARRDEARERREQVELRLREAATEALEAEAQELDDEIESLEAQLEVKAAIIADSNAAAARDSARAKPHDAFAELEPRLLAELLFDRLVDQHLRQHEMSRSIAALKLERNSMAESLAAAQLSQQQQQQQHDHVVTQMRRLTETRMRMLVDGMEAELEGDDLKEDSDVDVRKRMLHSSLSCADLPATVKLQLEEAQAPVQPWQHSAQPWLNHSPLPPGSAPATPPVDRSSAHSYTSLHRQRTARRAADDSDASPPVAPDDRPPADAPLDVFSRLHPHPSAAPSPRASRDYPPLRSAASMPRLPAVPAVSISLDEPPLPPPPPPADAAETDVFARLAAPRLDRAASSMPSFRASDADGNSFGGTHTLRGHQGFVFSLAAAKGQLFSASQDTAVRVWSLQPEQTGSVAELTGHHGFVRALAVSGGGALLFSGAQDKMVRVWDTHTHVQLCALPGHKAEVHALAVHNDLLFSGSEDASIKARALSRTSVGGSGMAAGDRWGEGRVPFLTSRRAQVWNIASLKCIRTLGGANGANGHTSAVFALAVCGEPCMLVSGSRDHTVRLWELASLEWKRTLHPPHLDCVQSFASLGNNLYSGSRDRAIKHWSLPDGALIGTINQAHEDWVCSLAVTESTATLASGGRDGRIKLWRLPKLEPCGVLEGHTGAVNCLISVNGLLGSEPAIVSCSSDRTIRVWKSKGR
ncbi:hypothetical protein AB1Y20_016664 [Prymnesium parvum]|uniref:Kinesin motor domain-containing protein n=1 Tax=Prymnesium parvum TaxID=97485 RepID=A0AB34IDA5_PRYPA